MFIILCFRTTTCCDRVTVAYIYGFVRRGEKKKHQSSEKHCPPPTLFDVFFTFMISKYILSVEQIAYGNIDIICSWFYILQFYRYRTIYHISHLNISSRISLRVSVNQLIFLIYYILSNNVERSTSISKHVYIGQWWTLLRVYICV